MVAAWPISTWVLPWGVEIYGSCPHDDLRLKALHFDTVNAFFGCGPDSRIGRIDLDVGFGTLEDGVVCDALPDLDLNLHAFYGCDLCLGIVGKAKNVCVIDLKLGLGIVAS
jgi:hypothetical protein